MKSEWGASKNCSGSLGENILAKKQATKVVFKVSELFMKWCKENIATKICFTTK